MVYDALNAVRSRAGIPNIEGLGDASLTSDPGRHTNQVGLREIIRHERLIELSFEGHRYNDIRRWKLGQEYFSTPVRGWSLMRKLKPIFIISSMLDCVLSILKDYLHPIKFNELTIINLIQNPGW